MVGKAEAQGHGGIELQAGDDAAEHHGHHHLTQEEIQIAHAETHGGQELTELLHAGEALQNRAQVHVRQMHDGETAQKEDDHIGQEHPDQGDDQLGPDQAVDADRQGVHQIALAGKQVFVEALDHHDDGQQLRYDDGDHREEDHHDQQDGEEGAGLTVQQTDGDVGQQHQQGQHTQNGQHAAAGGAKFIFQKLS